MLMMLMMLMLLLLGHCIDAETPCDDASAAGAFIHMRLRQKAADKARIAAIKRIHTYQNAACARHVECGRVVSFRVPSCSTR